MMVRCKTTVQRTNSLGTPQLIKDNQLTISDFVTRGKKIFSYHGELFSTNFFVFCRRLQCPYTNFRHVLFEKDVDKVKCMGLCHIKTFDESDT